MLRTPILIAALVIVMSQAAAAATLDRVRETGVFRIGYRADAKPYSFQDAKRQPAGYMVELCAEVAAALGPRVRAQYVQVPADQRLEAVRDGRVDILCDPTTATLQRREIVDFSLPTFLDGASVLSRQSKTVRSFEDLAGRRIGVLAGTTSERLLKQSLEKLGVKATVITVRDHRDGIDLVSSDKADAYFADRGILAAILREGDRPGFELSRPLFSYETYALALPRDDGAFRLLVDRTLSRLYRSGRINAILTKTFGHATIDDMLKTMFIINALPED